ncbi:MAG: VanW family protein [Fimbriimonadales bacterium]|nr:VanW family protein [Fimbriimonadales bacterium]
MRRGWLKAGLLTGLSLLGLGLGASLWLMSQQAPLPEGFRLMGVSPGGVRPAQLTDWLVQLDRTLSELPVQVEQSPPMVYPLREWGIQLDIPRTRDAVLQAWVRVPVWQKLLGGARAEIAPQWQVDDTAFQRCLQAFRSLERAPRDARVRYEQGTVEIVPEQPGQRLSVEGSRQNLLRVLTSANLAGSREIRFSLVLEPIAPRVTRETLHAVEGVVASYTTRFPGYQVNRNHNIRLAATALDGRVLLPGERLSYNEVVGERTLKQGFRLAPVIVRGEKRLGIGGGICQVSSTLFNAALLANLAIVRRVNHSIPVPYVPLGRDATVTDTGLDLVIENSLPHPVAFSVEIGRSFVTVRVLGKPVKGQKVVLRTQRLRTPPARIVLWRLIYQDSRLIRRERVATSVYRPPQPPRRKPSSTHPT